MSAEPWARRESTDGEPSKPPGLTRPCRGLAKLLWDADPETPWPDLAREWAARQARELEDQDELDVAEGAP